MSAAWRASAEAAGRLPVPAGRRSAEVLRHGALEIRYYAPSGPDAQTPHHRDEVYVVIRGHGHFVRGAERVPFGPGDVLFVPAKVAHRFEDFSGDLALWVMFYGPPGGEQDNPFL